MTLINGLEMALKEAGLEKEYSVHNSKGFFEFILDNYFIVDLQKAIIKDENGRTVCKAQLLHGLLKIQPLISELQFLWFTGWIPKFGGKAEQ